MIRHKRLDPPDRATPEPGIPLSEEQRTNPRIRAWLEDAFGKDVNLDDVRLHPDHLAPHSPMRHKRMDPPDRATPEPILEALVCPNCGDDMAEHAHHKCPECGYLEPCCQGEPQ